MTATLPRIWLTCAAVMTIAVSLSAAQTASDPLVALDMNMSAAEDSLQAGELQMAESRYRSALAAGWMLMGALRVAERRLPDARDAFLRASTSASDANLALQSLAVVYLQMGDAASAVAILTRRAGANSSDVRNRRLLAQALIANGQAEEAVQELEETAHARPDDPEITYALASGYLRLKKVDAAERLFGEVAKARPLPETYVLIGRTYRDAGQYDRARRALATALQMDPRVRRAHYYLGTVAVMADGVTHLDDAIAEFQQELRLAPNDAPTNLRLGMALVEARRDAAALPALEAAVRAESAPPEAFYYLGRGQLALNRVTSAVTSLRRALELAAASPEIDDGRLRSIHYQLALPRRRSMTAGCEASIISSRWRCKSSAQLRTPRRTSPKPNAFRPGCWRRSATDSAGISPTLGIPTRWSRLRRPSIRLHSPGSRRNNVSTWSAGPGPRSRAPT